MTVLDRYVVRSILIRIGAATTAFLVISVVVDLFERLDTFIDHEVPFLTIAEYYVSGLPHLFALTLPIASLIAVLFSLGGMARRNELIAMTASGLSLYRVLTPVLACGLLVSLIGFGFTIELVPRGNERAHGIYDHEIKGRPRISGSIRRDLNYLGTGGRYFLIRKFDGDAERMEDVVVQQFAEGTLVHRIDAKVATWNGEEWVFQNGYLRRFGPDGVRAEPFQERAFRKIREHPREFLRVVKESDEMTLMELREHIRRTRLSGGDVTRLEVQERMRYSFPFASFIVMLLGAPLTGAIRRGGHALGFGMALLVGFTYYVLLEVGKTLGYSGTLPPTVAAWLPNIVFSIVGLVGLWKTRK